MCVCAYCVCVVSRFVWWGDFLSNFLLYFLFIPRSPVSTHLQNPSYFMSTWNTAHRAGHDRSVFHTYVTIRKSDEDHHQKKQGESMAEPPKALQLSRPVRPSSPFSVAGTCMVRRATFNLLVQLRRRTLLTRTGAR